MNKIYIPEGYRANLDAYDTQRAIAYIKETFQQEFANALNLKRVSAPLFVTEESGLNDNLNGYERPVSFDVPAVGEDAQVVHSLAKWKRLALKRYEFSVGNGLYTDMNAIRRDEELDNIHSIYVDQWDWEKVITRENRNLDYLKLIVRSALFLAALVLYVVGRMRHTGELFGGYEKIPWLLALIWIIFLGLSLLLLIRWELTLYFHPERFAENTNACISCKVGNS